MEKWVTAKYIGEDLLVNKAGEKEWISLRDMSAKRKHEGPGTSTKTGGPPPPPAPLLGDKGKGKGDTRKKNDKKIDWKMNDASNAIDSNAKSYKITKLSSRYTESMDSRIKRMISEGKFGPALTRLATGVKGKGDEVGRVSDVNDANAGNAGNAGGTKRKADTTRVPKGSIDEKPGLDMKKAKKNSADTQKTIDGFNEWRHEGGYAQLPVFEPAKPVEIPLKVSNKATPDSRKKSNPSDDQNPKGKNPKPSNPKEIYLPVPAWCVEDAIEARRKKEKESSGFDRGGPRPAADPKAEDSDGDSDVSWSALPGTKEPVELLEERKRAKQEAIAKENVEAEEAAEAARQAAAEKKGKENQDAEKSKEKTEEELLSEQNQQLALCLTDPLIGEWKVPLSSDGFRWKEGGSLAADLTEHLEEHEDAPRRVVARRDVDDGFRVFGVGGYGNALKGVKLDTRLLKGKVDTGKGESDTGKGGVQATVASAKATSAKEIKAWFAETTDATEPKSPVRSEIDKPIAWTSELDELKTSVLSSDSAKSESIGEWFDECTRDVLVQTGDWRKEQTDLHAKSTPKESGKKQMHISTVMEPSVEQEQSAARVMGALHDAVMRQNKRIFYELVREQLAEEMKKR